MSDYVLFHMWEPFRQDLINRHLFYVDQARKRLLSQFDDMEAEADNAAESWLEKKDQFFDPNRSDPAEFYEAANDVAVEFYLLLSSMRKQTRLSLIAGMFHQWDKSLREWLAKEIMHWHRGSAVCRKIWSVPFDEIIELLECLGCKNRGMDYFHKIDACRLIVNIYKHGNGKSAEELELRYPEYLPVEYRDRRWTNLDHCDIEVDDKQFAEFSDAIVVLWKSVPEYIHNSEITSIPNWFRRALEDQATA